MKRMPRLVTSILAFVAPTLLLACGSSSPTDANAGNVDSEWAQTTYRPSPKKGVGSVDWSYASGSKALADARVAWMYNWHAWPWKEADAVSSGVEFVPMVRYASSVNEKELSVARYYGKTLLGFNEPDHKDQADMTVQQALDLWPQLMQTGLRLGSPVSAGNPSEPGSWLEQFMAGAKERGYRVDFICVHWYGANFDSTQAVTELEHFLTTAHDKYNLPIWLTEFSLIRWIPKNTFPFFEGLYPSQEEQAAFVPAAVSKLETLPYVERYAWFGLSPWPERIRGESTNLYDWNGTATPVGVAFRQAGLQQ